MTDERVQAIRDYCMQGAVGRGRPRARFIERLTRSLEYTTQVHDPGALLIREPGGPWRPLLIGLPNNEGAR